MDSIHSEGLGPHMPSTTMFLYKTSWLMASVEALLFGPTSKMPPWQPQLFPRPLPPQSPLTSSLGLGFKISHILFLKF